ncbi:HpcH/HpaI aldolase/citrate lyase family protein [soil metagenome]
MRHFSYLGAKKTSALFHSLPQQFSRESPAPLLAVALGATLYSPGTRTNLAADVVKQAGRGSTSIVLCLEDSVADGDVERAEQNVVSALRKLSGRTESARSVPLPLLFVRVRTPQQMLSIAERAGVGLDLLSGFVVPKFDNRLGYAERFLDALHTIHERHGQGGGDGRRRLRIMPILESDVMIHIESRQSALVDVQALLRENRDDILAVRIGATDFSSTFGLRRSRDLNIYDVKVVSAVIADIVNILGRRDDGFVITGPVWEHFANTERLLRPQLRLTPFAESNDEKLRRRLLTKNFDGLMHEIALDQANGLQGKTVIHPSHVAVVHSMSVVSHEEFLDAEAIAGNVGGGAAASPYGNKMNEMKPHQAWAERTLLRAAAFGVAAEDVSYVDLLEASMR